MVSILLPVFNAAPFLEDCLESILQQTFENWELIAVDDFSTDSSFSILEKYAAKDSRIKVCRNSTKGIIPALRKALARSEGQHITRMDADDIMTRDKLLLMQAVCRPKTVVTGKVEYFRSDGELGEGYIRYAHWLNNLVDRDSHWLEIYKECVIPSPAWMVERQTLKDIGAFDSNTYPEDYDLVFRMYASRLKVIGIDSLLHRWRDHGARASRNDVNYQDNRFFDLKLAHFLAIDFDENISLALWGAGRKGKYCARWLIEKGINFSWHTDNIKKLNVKIYGKQLESSQDIPCNSTCLLVISSPASQHELNHTLNYLENVTSYRLV
jgi:glycosyltransferase involved in cell wall biosynthesis